MLVEDLGQVRLRLMRKPTKQTIFHICAKQEFHKHTNFSLNTARFHSRTDGRCVQMCKDCVNAHTNHHFPPTKSRFRESFLRNPTTAISHTCHLEGAANMQF
eukprot:EG_transcript_38944